MATVLLCCGCSARRRLMSAKEKDSKRVPVLCLIHSGYDFSWHVENIYIVYSDFSLIIYQLLNDKFISRQKCGKHGKQLYSEPRTIKLISE